MANSSYEYNSAFNREVDRFLKKTAHAPVVAGSINFSQQPASVGIKKLDDMPDGIEESQLPWFIGELPSEDIIKSVKGMSGGPIMGFQFKPQLRYWIVAMQSRQIGRIILGCPVPVFMGIFENAIADNRGGRRQSLTNSII